MSVTDDNLHFGSAPDDPTGVRDCAACQGEGTIDRRPCPECSVRQQLRNAWWSSGPGPERLRRKLLS